MSDATESVIQSASENHPTPLERVLLCLEERYERLIFYVIARDGAKTHRELNDTPEVNRYVLVSGEWTDLALRKLDHESILTQDASGKYSVTSDWQDVATWITKSGRTEEDSLLGVGEWTKPTGLVVTP